MIVSPLGPYRNENPPTFTGRRTRPLSSTKFWSNVIMPIDSLLESLSSKRPSRFGKISLSDQDWLAKQEEEAILFPDQPIVDPHHHLWDMPGYRYLLDEFAADISTGHNVVATVFAECSSMWRADGPEPLRPIGETEFVLGQGAMSRSGKRGPGNVAAGIIGFADLTLGSAVEDVLDAQLKAANGRFKGIRHEANWDASLEVGNAPTGAWQGMLLEGKTSDGFRKLQQAGLTFDAWVYQTQLDDICTIADRFPDLTIILNHCGGPLGYGPYANQQDENFRNWDDAIRKVAKRPNVMCKVGGILSRSATFDYIHAEVPPTSDELLKVWLPYFATCLEIFGESRSMFESNFPVEKMGTGYRTLLNVFKKFLSSASPEQRQAFFFGNANRVYRLGLPGSSILNRTSVRTGIGVR